MPDNRRINSNKTYYMHNTCAITTRVVQFYAILPAAQFCSNFNYLWLSQCRLTFRSFAHTLVSCYGYTHKTSVIKFHVFRWNVPVILYRKLSWCLYNSVCYIILLTLYSIELRNLFRKIIVLIFCVTKLMPSTKNYCTFLTTSLIFYSLMVIVRNEVI